jgi:hypothetical protein
LRGYVVVAAGIEAEGIGREENGGVIVEIVVFEDEDGIWLILGLDGERHASSGQKYVSHFQSDD